MNPSAEVPPSPSPTPEVAPRCPSSTSAPLHSSRGRLECSQALPRPCQGKPSPHRSLPPSKNHLPPSKNHLLPLWGRCGVWQSLQELWKCQVSLWPLLERLRSPQAGNAPLREALAPAPWSRWQLLQRKQMFCYRIRGALTVFSYPGEQRAEVSSGLPQPGLRD